MTGFGEDHRADAWRSGRRTPRRHARRRDGASVTRRSPSARPRRPRRPRWYSCSGRTWSAWRGPVGHAVGGGEPGGAGGEQRHAVRAGGGADVGAVGPRAPAPGAVDDQLDLAALDEVDRVADRRHRRAWPRPSATSTPGARRWSAVPEVAAIAKPELDELLGPPRTPVALSRSASERNTVPELGQASCPPPAGSWRRPGRR